MVQTPVVSVVMPVYNGANYIKQAIDSVMTQTVPLELIIIDDCSTDQTAQVVADAVRAYESAEEQSIVYCKNHSNLGASGSRTKGVTMARADWIAFLDADDWWAPGKLARQMALLKKTGFVLCCTARSLVDTKGVSLNHLIHVKEEITYHDLLFHNSINCSSVVIKKEAMLAYPMCHEDSHEDYISWLQILKHYGSACGIDEPLLFYRYDKGSKSGNKLKSAAMTFRVYRYLGFNLIQSIGMFCSYAVHGILKYTRKG
jgi:teichuronic acid biosynthesis glycosyltransferase TuaG